MTIASTVSEIAYVGSNGITGPFPVPFYFGPTTDLEVELDGVLTTAFYTSDEYTDTAYLNFVSPLVGTPPITIKRKTAITQQLTLSLGADFDPGAYEGNFDKLIRIDQDQQRQIDVLTEAFDNTTDAAISAAAAAASAASAAASQSSATAAASAASTAYGSLQAIVGAPGFSLTPGSYLLDDISGSFNGVTTTFNLTLVGVAKTPANAAQLLVHLSIGYQIPGTHYTVAGSQITFATAPVAGINCAMVLVQIDTSNVTTSAAAAAASASAAATSATNASTSATAAQTAQTAAELARDQALTAYDNFDDRFLGAKAVAPTLDNDGNALVAGSLYYDTVAAIMKVWTGSQWVVAYGSFATALGIDYAWTGSHSFSKTIAPLSVTFPDGTVLAGEAASLLDDISAGFDGVTTVFALKKATVAFTPRSATVMIVNVGGVVQMPGSGYTQSGTNITFTSAPIAGVPCSIQVFNV